MIIINVENTQIFRYFIFLGLYDEWKVHLNYSTVGMLKDRMLKKSLELNLSLWQM